MEKQFEEYADLLRNYVKEHVTDLLKEPRSFIHYPFIDPGSVYDGNVWDWDTYWSAYGLLGMMDAFEPAIQEKILIHARGNVQNFLDHQLDDGYIPMMIEVKDWPEPYLNMRHKEGVLMNMHKPFLCGQICLISDYTGDYGWIFGALDGLRSYFACYDANYYFENCGLYVWCDDIMIGMDNDPASFGRPKFSTANIFLNSFMVHELSSMARILEKLGRPDVAAGYREKAENLSNAILEECWDKRDQFFYSADVDIKTRKYDWFHEGLGVFWKTLPIKIRVWSGFIPLWAGFATKEQAASLARHWKDESTFHSPFGITTLAKDEKMFDLSATNNPSNWLGPIWLVANYVVFRGLLNYGYRDEAEEICKGSLKLLGEDLKKTGCLHEYYNPFDGSPVMNGGFINWNILALNMKKELEE
ncbi:MAG TPA: trehalase / alfa-L-rhamnosidase / mannosyl oligosaccharide glucosidase [Candidatus Limivivens intestinipullorum]|uniref:Trehalase / alfa-L-rhamnosidase / mannosyl oligosaccharide glucosidase n=1 Tax=Candidatus Limivivens intestinipullorum TaxID=2840858 RepID=A0A9D1ETH2_9FIRM|nr:trehalase / alfa-L-rhamnosidase / mannosyl oligosaccharide glucosidase [Candidatus Limivivens intestinipullorum]